MKLVYAEVGARLSAEGYSVVKLLTWCVVQVDGGGWCVVNPELLVVLHVSRDFREEAFRLSGK